MEYVMRMWNVPTRMMCRQHLLGEHLEMHMFMGSIKDGKKLDGFIRNGLVELENVKKRHDELVDEMKTRGYNHKSPLEIYDPNLTGGRVNSMENIEILKGRCEQCRMIEKSLS